MNKKLGFVILNYNGNEVTINCVNSLLEYYKGYPICIVDNNSEKNPIDNIYEKYKDIEEIIILKAKKNYGFAVGNNIGINFLRELGVENIAVVNNDTIFQNSDLINKLEIKNLKENIAVLSLELDNKDGTKQLPYGLIKGAYKSYIKIGILNFAVITRLFDVYKFFKNLFRKKKVENENINLEIDFNKYEFIISGAAYILTPNFFKYYNQLFNKTFLYCEEHILALYLKKAKLKTEFIRDTKIIHLESQTANLTSFSIKKVKLGFASWFKSLRLLLKSHKKINKKYSKKNYMYEELKQIGGQL